MHIRKISGCFAEFKRDKNKFTRKETILLVSNKYRGMGCAKTLMNFAKDYAQRHGSKSIKVDTHRANLPMQNLLINSGYTYQGIIDLNRNEEDQLRLAYELVI